MNEAGLVTNLLALVESDYGKPTEGAKVISMSTWAQYVLDNFATVAEVLSDLQKEEFRVQTVVLPTGRPANMHLAISDATGDSAIFEYVNGELVIHHGKQYKVLTNSPTYDQQLAIMEYWKDEGGLSKSLPGTSRAADRFVRASFLAGAIPTETSPKYISGSPQQKFQYQAAMSVLSVMRSVGTPLGYSLDDEPWVSSTIWRTVSDSTNRVVMFDSAMTPSTFWVRLDDLDLKPGAPVKKPELVGGKTYSGNATDKFIDAKMFEFADLKDLYEPVGVVGVFGAEQAALLQDRHHLFAEDGEIAGPSDAEIEAVAGPADEPALDGVGDGPGRADEIGAPDAEAVGRLAQSQVLLARHAHDLLGPSLVAVQAEA